MNSYKWFLPVQEAMDKATSTIFCLRPKISEIVGQNGFYLGKLCKCLVVALGYFSYLPPLEARSDATSIVLK